MKKLAIFVEGYTEAVFAEKLVYEIAGQNKVQIEHRKILGGSTTKKTMKLIKAANPVTEQEYFVLIYDCGGDALVKTRIKEEHENLTKSGYEKVIGIRDVRPEFEYSQISKLELGLPTYIKTKFIPVTFILAIMEIEAWFLGEHTHFTKIDPTLTIELIKSNLGFDPENENMELRDTPAIDLQSCYSIVGKSYKKGQVQDTVDVLDYEYIYLEGKEKFPYLKKLVNEIDGFLS
jgi:hypothetical protein